MTAATAGSRFLFWVLGGNPGAFVPSMVTALPRYFGMSADRVIGAGDFPGANSNNENSGAFPANAGNAYAWFAVPESEGAVVSVTRPPNPVNQLVFYPRQAGVVQFNGADYVVYVAQAASPPRNSERRINIGF